MLHHIEQNDLGCTHIEATKLKTHGDGVQDLSGKKQANSCEEQCRCGLKLATHAIGTLKHGVESMRTSRTSHLTWVTVSGRFPDCSCPRM